MGLVLRWAFSVGLVLLSVACGGQAHADRPTGPGGAAPGGGRWISGETGKLRYLVDEDGHTYLGLWVEAPEHLPSRRAPMAVSLVIDTSGSMSGERIAHARSAAADVIRTLRDGDIVSVIAFESSVHEWAEPTVLSSDTRPMLLERVRALEATGGTNMYSGLALGEERLRVTPDSHPVRRLVLISDGHANEGPSDPASLGLLAAQGTDHGVQVTAIGVGQGYNEAILNELAARSAGRLYHLEHPAQMATILRDELGLLARTVATDAWIEIVPAPGVFILGIETLGGEMVGGRARVKLGSLVAGQRRGVLLRAKVDTAGLGERAAATAALHYRDAGGGKRARTEDTVLSYEVVRDRKVAEASRSTKVNTLVASLEAARVEQQAVASLNRGDTAAAAEGFVKAADDLARAASAAPTGSAARAKLERRAVDYREKAKKARSASSPGAARGAALESNADSFGALSGMD